ncbi:MAG: M20 metallopeptidase family protein [Cetobacterium sp.]
MNSNLDKIDKVIDKYIDKIIAFRRDIHQYPELGNSEIRTAQKIIEILSELPLEIKSKVSGEGIVASLYGEGNGKTLLFRGDMDALPMTELSNLEYASKVPNVMHSCGHDIHSSIILGTAIVLSELKDLINGNVKFLFQPAEECSPIGGAQGMINEGVLDSPKVDEAYGLHVFGRKVGSVEFRPGIATSKSDKFKVEIKGKSSHGSIPNEGKDAIIVAANIISAIQTIVSRNMALNERAVVTVGTINGGTRYNVISDYVKLEGTVRSFDDSTVKIIKKRMQRIVEDIASAYDCEGVLTYEDGYGFIYNDLEISEYSKKMLEDLYGSENVIVQQNPLSIAEDFSYISKKVPSLFLWLGAEDELHKGKCMLHSPEFIASEKSIKEGIRIFCKIALDRAGI